MGYDFDLITIGGGSGGVAASRRSATFGAKVALCEPDRVGGTCVLRGCVPKKLLVYGASFGAEFADAAGFGWTVDAARCDFARLQAAKDREFDRLNGVYLRLLAEAGVSTFFGRARLVDPHTVHVGGDTLTAERILVATGGWPVVPDIPGREHCITSNEALSLPSLPRRMLVIGGGYIGIEMACIFHALGVEVTLLCRGSAPLRCFDHDARAHLTALLTHRGIRIHGPVEPVAVEKLDGADEGALLVRTSEGERFIADVVLMATGRAPNTAGLGLERLGVRLSERGAILVDEYSRSSVDSIYAIGDCTDRVNLTPMAVAEGRALAETLYRNNPTKVEKTLIPTAVFSMPPLACVGLTEAAAQAQDLPLDIYSTAFRPMKNALAGRDERTFMKLVVEQRSQRVLGCHMVGPDAPEIIQALAVAITAGATKRDFDRTLALHPTAAEEFVLMREPRKR
jgi:glutathione reductase (NADPH)